MSTHMPGFQLVFRFFASFCTGQFSNQLHKGYLVRTIATGMFYAICISFTDNSSIPQSHLFLRDFGISIYVTFSAISMLKNVRNAQV